jgi:hypothetical protein
MAMLSPAGQALGFGNTGVSAIGSSGGAGNMLREQTADEIEEERKKRLLGLSTMQTSPLARIGSPFAAATPAGKSLFGGMMR